MARSPFNVEICTSMKGQLAGRAIVCKEIGLLRRINYFL